MKRSDLAALVIARLREIGQASSLFGVAASVGTVLGYREPDATGVAGILGKRGPFGAQLHFQF